MIKTPSICQSSTASLDIAVNDLAGRGVEQSTALIISDRLRSELITTDVFKVMERNAMEDILKEQSFQKTGACNEATCLVEVGQLLGVDRMISGTTGKIGDLYTLSLRMINVATGQIIFTVDEDYEGDIKGFLSTTIKNAAVKLASCAGNEIRKVSMRGRTGDIYITSEPSGAMVEIDGVAEKGVTPLTLQKVTVGDHRVVIRKNEFYGATSLSLSADDLLKVNIVLQRGKGGLKIFTTPDGATVFIDNENKGITPCKIDNFQAGEHRVLIEKEGYLQQTHLVKIGIDTIITTSYTLSPAAYLTVFASDPKAEIFINNARVGSGAVYKYVTAPGAVSVNVTSPSSESVNRTVDLDCASHDTMRIDLVSLFGALEINSSPDNADVIINGRKCGMTPYRDGALQPGKYMVNLLKNSYRPIIDSVNLSKNGSMVKLYTLEHTQPYLDSLSAARAVRKKRNQMIRRITFGSASVISWGCGLFYTVSANKALEKYQDNNGYDVATHDDEWNAYKSKLQPRDISCILASFLSIGFAVSIPF